MCSASVKKELKSANVHKVINDFLASLIERPFISDVRILADMTANNKYQKAIIHKICNCDQSMPELIESL